MEDKRRGSGGRTALHILAFIGVAVLLIAIALTAALWITTKGPSATARDEFVVWADDHGLGFAAGLFLSDAEENAALNPGSEDETPPAASEQPMIIVADPDDKPAESPEAEGDDAPAGTGAPESPAPSESEEAEA